MDTDLVGRIVILKSGGPRLTVTDVYDDGVVKVVWFLDGVLTAYVLPLECVISVYGDTTSVVPPAAVGAEGDKIWGNEPVMQQSANLNVEPVSFKDRDAVGSWARKAGRV